jgi:Enterobacter phage Enc34, ssDNA-binding protein
MAKSVCSPYGVLAFPNLFEPRSVPGTNQEPRFSTILIFDEQAQKKPEFKALQDAIIAAADEKWPRKADQKNLRWPIRKSEEKEGAQGFNPGSVFFNAWTKTQPGIVDRNRNEILTKAEVWAGQLARVFVRPFAYDTSGNKGVSLMLENVQIVKSDMPRIDGRKSASESFTDVTEFEDEDAL